MNLLLLASSVVGATIIFPALAQPMYGSCRFGPDSDTCITVNFQLSVPQPATASPSDWPAALTKANQMLFDIINRECDALRPATNGHCQLTQLNLNANMNDHRMGPNATMNTSASATFDIGSPPAEPAAKP